MEINATPAPAKLLQEFEITYINGAIMSITLDLVAGDSYELGPNLSVFKSVAKPSWTRPNVTTPAKEVTVVVSNVLCIEHEVRTVEDPTPEQREQWTQVLKDITGPQH